MDDQIALYVSASLQTAGYMDISACFYIPTDCLTCHTAARTYISLNIGAGNTAVCVDVTVNLLTGDASVCRYISIDISALYGAVCRHVTADIGTYNMGSGLNIPLNISSDIGAPPNFHPHFLRCAIFLPPCQGNLQIRRIFLLRIIFGLCTARFSAHHHLQREMSPP